MQWEIIEALAREFFSGAGARDTVRTVFAVGDEKQSIYSFQGAEPEKFGLMGKRFDAEMFVDEVARSGGHACDYLFTVDMEMEPVPGYKAASWAQGYGDFTIKPDLATMRRTPWLEGTAIVLGDVCDHHGHPMPHAPRSILKKQIARLTERGWTAKMASELEFYVIDEPYDQARAKNHPL